jgi:hypothetical protein
MLAGSRKHITVLCKVFEAEAGVATFAGFSLSCKIGAFLPADDSCVARAEFRKVGRFTMPRLGVVG